MMLSAASLSRQRSKRQTHACIVCPRCRQQAVLEDYFCSACGEHHDALYLAEHPDPARARTMTRADIIAEYATVGKPFHHNPELEAGASNHLHDDIMYRLRNKGE